MLARCRFWRPQTALVVLRALCSVLATHGSWQGRPTSSREAKGVTLTKAGRHLVGVYAEDGHAALEYCTAQCSGNTGGCNTTGNITHSWHGTPVPVCLRAVVCAGMPVRARVCAHACLHMCAHAAPSARTQ